MMSKASTFAIAIALATGCLGSDPARGAAIPLTERCEGTYWCEAPDGSVTTMELDSPPEAPCRVGPFLLWPDGSATDDSEIGFDSWAGDSALFSICNDETATCVTCGRITPSGPGSDPTDAGEATTREDEGVCRGSAPSCLSESLGGCYEIDGCYTSSRFRWNGDIERYCTGVSRRCSGYDSPDPCRRQGCRWDAPST